MHFKSKHLGSLMKPNPQSHSARQFIPNFSAHINTRMTVEWGKYLSWGLSHVSCKYFGEELYHLWRENYNWEGSLCLPLYRTQSSHMRDLITAPPLPPRWCYHTSGQCITINTTPPCVVRPRSLVTLYTVTLSHVHRGWQLLVNPHVTWADRGDHLLQIK